MTSQFQKLQLQPSIATSYGIKIASPLSGHVRPLHEHPDPLARAGFLGEGLLILPDSPMLIAPFHGRYERSDQVGGMIRFIHQNGLRMTVRFPDNPTHHGQGFHWQMSWQGVMRQGQELLQFDPLLLANGQGSLPCVVTLQDHPRFARILSPQHYVRAHQDILFLIELKEAQTA